MIKCLAVSVLFFIFINPILGQKLWQKKNEASILKNLGSCKSNNKIRKFETWQLNLKRFKKISDKAKSKEFKIENIIISLPYVDGLLKHFKIYDSNTMSPELAKQFPNIKSYLGECIEDKLLTARIDLNDFGLHVLINNSQGQIYLIEPYCNTTNVYYHSYLKSDYNSDRKPFYERK